MGFAALAPREHISRSSILGLVRRSIQKVDPYSLESSGVQFGQFGDILVSREPRPRDMAAVLSEYRQPVEKIRPFQDEAFFRWRFDNGLRKYVFYYLMSDKAVSAFIVVGISPNGWRGNILDYAEAGTGGIEAILRHVIKTRRFPLFSIYRFGADRTLLRTLKRLGFTEHGLSRILERTRDQEPPVVVRPAKVDRSESDFVVEGLNMRKIDNWALKPICSDGL
jgi:hypothetical protein